MQTRGEVLMAYISKSPADTRCLCMTAPWVTNSSNLVVWCNNRLVYIFVGARWSYVKVRFLHGLEYCKAPCSVLEYNVPGKSCLHFIFIFISCSCSFFLVNLTSKVPNSDLGIEFQYLVVSSVTFYTRSVTACQRVNRSTKLSIGPVPLLRLCPPVGRPDRALL